MNSAVLAILKPEEYDFASSEVVASIIGKPEISVRLGFADMVMPCRPPDKRTALVDDTICAKVILSTDEWSLVMPIGNAFPVVVETRRCSFMGKAD